MNEKWRRREYEEGKEERIKRAKDVRMEKYKSARARVWWGRKDRIKEWTGEIKEPNSKANREREIVGNT